MTQTRKLSSPPSSLTIYGRAALGAIPGAGALPFVGGRGKEVPDVALELEASADPAALADYCRVCGFTVRNTLPPTYPHILAFPLHMALITDPAFPLPAAGLVHIANSITQHRPIGTGERLELRVRSTPLEPHPKGRQFSLLTEARVDGELVWESSSTNLHRGGGSGEAERQEGPELPNPLELQASAEWRLPGDLGRRYAAVSGDHNPIHLYGLTAKAFGFPRAIAHGMWTKARSLAALERELGDSFAVHVRFLRPILLPGKVVFAAARREDGIDFGVRNAKGETPHLTGRLEPSAG